MPQPRDSPEPGASARIPTPREFKEFEQLLQRLRDLYACAALDIPKLEDGLEFKELDLKKNSSLVVQPHIGPRKAPFEVVLGQSDPDSDSEPTLGSVVKESPAFKQSDSSETATIQDATSSISPPALDKKMCCEPPYMERQEFLNDFKDVQKCNFPKDDFGIHASEPPGTLRKWVRSLVYSMVFEAVSSAVILLNCCVLGWAADRNFAHVVEAHRRGSVHVSTGDDGVNTIQWLMTCWFMAEVTMRMIAAGRGFFLRDRWNIFDMVVVVLDIFDTVVNIINHEGGRLPNFTPIRVVRVLRIARALRIIKLMHGFRDFRMMVQSIIHSGSSLCWMTVLFSFMIFLFSIYFMQQVTSFLANETVHQHDRDQLVGQWGSLSKSYYTLFLCMSGGISWVEISGPLLQIHWVNTAVLSFYIFFMTFVVTNIVMGIFVESVIQSAQGDREEVVEATMNEKNTAISQLRQIFLEADEDGNRMITLQEFQRQSQDRHIWACLSSLGLEVSEACGLFKLLDVDGSGTIGIEEFLMGCMRLKGYAKTVDLATLMYENKRLTHHANSFYKFARQEFETLVERVGRIERNCLELKRQSR